MDIPQNEPQPQIQPQPAPSGLDKKRLLIIAGSIGCVMLIIVGIVFLMPGKKNVTQNTVDGQVTKAPTQDANGFSSESSAVPTVQGTDPTVVAESFYYWYVGHPAPLAAGAYKTRNDITEEYKKTMDGYVRRGLSTDRDDVFNCGDPLGGLPKTIKSQPAQIDIVQGLALVPLQDSAIGQNKFLIKLKKSGETWLVRDVWCAP